MAEQGKNNRGVTLTELIVVIAIVGILAVALGFQYTGWQGRYKVESQVKEVYSDLMRARVNAMQRNLWYFADFPSAATYRIIEDTNDNGALNVGAGDTILPTFPKTLASPLTLTWAGGWISFDQRGIISTELGGLKSSNAVPIDEALCMFTDYNGDKVSDFDPDYDCIILSKTRIVMGKLIKQNTDGGKCAPVLQPGKPGYDVDNACQAK